MAGRQLHNIGEAPVGIIAGSISDLQKIANSRMKEVFEANGIDYELHVISADRNPEIIDEYCATLAKANKTRIIIAVAGLSAKLPAVLASRIQKPIPVFGVPLDEDALRTMIQQPKGAPVAVCGAIGEFGLYNTALIVAMIFANEYSGNGILFAKFLKELRAKKPAVYNAVLPEPEKKT